MKIQDNLESLTISELIKQFEDDIRYDCHSLRARVSRSQAGKELERRAKSNVKEVIPALGLRLDEMNRQSLNGVESSVRSGINMLLKWSQSK